MKKYIPKSIYTTILILILMFGGWDKGYNQIKVTEQWQRLNEFHVRDIIEYKGELVFCSKQGIFTLTEKLHSKPAYCLATNDSVLVAGTNDGLLVFDSTWHKVEIIQNGIQAQVRSVKNYNELFFLGHSEGSYGITTWHPKKGIIYSNDFHAYIRSIEINDSCVYAGDEDGNIWISNNMGRSFDSTIHLDNQRLAVRSIRWINDEMYVAAGWIFKNYEKSGHYITPMDFYMNFVLSGDQGIFIYDDDLKQLVAYNEGLDDLRVSRLFLHDGNLYIGTVTGLFKRPYKSLVRK
jgi:ligand-binding sensor domain-containing protein